MRSESNATPSMKWLEKMTGILQEKLGEGLDAFLIPPPVFTFMEGEFIAFNEHEGWLKARFPIKYEYLNPYKVMQGGIIAAAIDNTLGPLSILIAPPNVTRTLEIKYSTPISMDLGFIIVNALLLEREGRELCFKAEVRSEQGKLLARAWARHWITSTEFT
jgi:acyl-coenzyme A thioesterase PaaI-like protein